MSLVSRTFLTALAAVGVLGLGLVGPGPAAAAPPGAVTAGNSPRICSPDLVAGDRALSVCVSYWSSGTGQYRGVVAMHSYRWANGARAGDSVSKTLTLNDGTLAHNGIYTFFGTEYGAGTCRVNSPSGPVSSCSTPNTAAVTYYGKAWSGSGSPTLRTCVWNMSWRDDRNVARFFDFGATPFCYPPT